MAWFYKEKTYRPKDYPGLGPLTLVKRAGSHYNLL